MVQSERLGEEPEFPIQKNEVMHMQERDYAWFLENYKSLYEQYGMKYLAIKNQIVLGAYSSYAEAVRETELTEELGTFIVQLCNGSETAYTNYISSLNIVFT